MTASKKQAVLGVFWGTVERAATQGISFAIVVLLARILGPESIGLVTLAATIALFGQMLLGETFSQALIQQKNLNPAHISSLFWLLIAVGIGAALLQAFLAGAIGGIFNQAELAPILRALSPLLLLTALQAVPAAMFKRALDFRALATASALGTALGGIAGISLALSGFGYWSLVANLLVQNAAIAAAIWRQSPVRPQFSFSGRHLGELWSYGKYNFLARLAAFSANQFPRILVGYLFGPAALGAFSLGLRMIEFLYQLISMPAVNVVVSLTARVREEPQRLARAILSATQFSAMVSAPVFIALALLAPFAVPLVFGEKWIASIPVVQLLCAYGLVGTCGLIWGGIIAGLGRPDVTLVTTTAAAAVSVTVLLLASRWGLTASALAFVVRGYVTLPFMPLVIARLTGLGARLQYGVYLPIILSAAIMAITVEAVILIFEPALSPPELTAISGALGVAAYAASLYILARPALRHGASFLAQLRPIRETA